LIASIYLNKFPARSHAFVQLVCNLSQHSFVASQLKCTRITL